MSITMLGNLPLVATWLAHLDGHLLEQEHWQGKDLQIELSLKNMKQEGNATNQVMMDHQY
jgi:hypothetical protein